MCYDILFIQAATRLWSAVRLEGTHSFVNLNGFMHHASREPADRSIKEWRTLPRGVFNGAAGLQLWRGLIHGIWINVWLWTQTLWFFKTNLNSLFFSVYLYLNLFFVQQLSVFKDIFLIAHMLLCSIFHLVLSGKMEDHSEINACSICFLSRSCYSVGSFWWRWTKGDAAWMFRACLADGQNWRTKQRKSRKKDEVMRWIND